jgi:hypothetical protein
MMPPLPSPIEREPPPDAPSCFEGLTVAEAAALQQDELDARLEALVRERREATQ